MKDGCKEASLRVPEAIPASITVEDGKTNTFFFTDASDTFGFSIDNFNACGARMIRLMNSDRTEEV